MAAAADGGLDLLLAPLGRNVFFEKYWERHPLVLRATPERRAFFSVERPDADVLAGGGGAGGSGAGAGGASSAARPAPPPPPPADYDYTPSCDFSELVRRASDPSQPPLRWGLDVNAARAVPRRGKRGGGKAAAAAAKGAAAPPPAADVERQTPNAGERGDPAAAGDLWRLFAPAAFSAPPPPASSRPSQQQQQQRRRQQSDPDDRHACSFQLMQPQRWSGGLWRLAAALEGQLGALVGINSYITPPEAQGLAPHWDDVEVLVVQTRGAKKWHLRRNGGCVEEEEGRRGGGRGDGGDGSDDGSGSDSDGETAAEAEKRDGALSLPSTPSGDLPLPDALNRLGRFEAKKLFARKPLGGGGAGGGADVDQRTGLVSTVTLYPGDVLYMPRGTVHWAEAVDAEESRGTAQGAWRGAGGGGSGSGSGKEKDEGGSSRALRERALCHSAHLTISTYQRWSHGDLLMYLLDGALHRPAGAAPLPDARGGLPLSLRRSPPAGFAFGCGLERNIDGVGSLEVQDLACALGRALADLTTRLTNALMVPPSSGGGRNSSGGANLGLLPAAARRMAAADFWPHRLPPHPAQLWDRGPAPELGSSIAWRALRWATVLPVGEQEAPPGFRRSPSSGRCRVLPDVPDGYGGGCGGGKNGPERWMKIVSCLHNARASHMVPPPPGAGGSEEDEDEDEEDEDEDEEDEDEEEEDEDDEGGSGQQISHGSSSSLSGQGQEDDGDEDEEDGSSDDNDDDDDDDDEEEEGGPPGADPSDPASALDGVVMPGRLLPGVRQLISRAESAAGLEGRQHAWLPGAGDPRGAAVPVRALEGARGDGERLRLAYSLWCAGLVSTVAAVQEEEKKKQKKKNKEEERLPTKKKEDIKKSKGGPVVGKRGPAAQAARGGGGGGGGKRARCR